MTYPTLAQRAATFARVYPTPAHHRLGGGSTWDQWCGAAMWRFCEAYGTAPTGDVHSAYHVYTRSKIVSTDPSKALPGDFHFWSIAGPDNGHVMVDILGGGRRIFGATASAASISGATALGYLSVAGYTRAKRGRAAYLGFSRGYADGDVTRFSLPAPPMPAPRPSIPTTTTAKLGTLIAAFAGKEEEDMGFYITLNANAPKFWLNQATGRKRSISQAEWRAARASESAGGPALVVAIVSAADLNAITGR
jgi:hypothetical protein